jgi:EAL domain-containing protein (putative c-di-GMP-specific phosphodiesterase class I)/GGDEF domain-containing protein
MTIDNKSALIRSFSHIAPALDEEIKKAIASNSTGGLLCVSIDNFAMIISIFGRTYSEKLMLSIMNKISSEVGNIVTIVRSGKGKINIILNFLSTEDVKEKAAQIRKIIQNFGCDESAEPIHIKPKIGSVDFPNTSCEAMDALDKAYIALSDAEDVYKNYVAYGDIKNHKSESKNQMILANYIHDAYLNNKLRLAFQPIINSRTGEIAYYESLLRIVNDDGTTSSAGPFIPIAEKLGFIDEIDQAVLKMVIAELYKTTDLVLSVNLSNTSINESDWIDVAKDFLKDRSIAERLIVEITETSEATSVNKVQDLISILQELGCRVALDDFGTGYTSFLQLKNLPVDMIKIDGSFVRDIATNEQNQFFVRTLMEFSRMFNLKTVAEFVEDQRAVNILIEMGVDYMQGNYFSPAVNYRDWIVGDKENT